MSDSAVCWKCGASLAQLSLPLLRRDVCKSCGAALHVCKLCRFYDVSVAKHCREPIAEWVRDKERANYCDYFDLKVDAYSPAPQAASETARAKLDALFGKPQGIQQSDAQSSADAARAALESLFGGKNSSDQK